MQLKQAHKSEILDMHKTEQRLFCTIIYYVSRTLLTMHKCYSGSSLVRGLARVLKCFINNNTYHQKFSLENLDLYNTCF